MGGEGGGCGGGRELGEHWRWHPLEWHQDGRGSVWQVLRQYSINLSEEEFFHILEYYDKTLSSKISYNDFLRAFLQ